MTRKYNHFLHDLAIDNVLCQHSDVSTANFLDIAEKQCEALLKQLVFSNVTMGHVAITKFHFHERGFADGSFHDACVLPLCMDDGADFLKSFVLYGLLKSNNHGRWSVTDFFFKNPSTPVPWVVMLGDTSSIILTPNASGLYVKCIIPKALWNNFLHSSCSDIISVLNEVPDLKGKDHRSWRELVALPTGLCQKTYSTSLVGAFNDFISACCKKTFICNDTINLYPGIVNQLHPLLTSFCKTLLSGVVTSASWNHVKCFIFSTVPVFVEKNKQRSCAGIFLTSNGDDDPASILDELQPYSSFLSSFWSYTAYEHAAVSHIKRHARKSATAAIFSRNMSHNLGSHALANSKFFQGVGILDSDSGGNFGKEEIQKARGRLQSFNQYCQGRLDYIARKLSEDDDKAEPLFLINDVLMGFMSQQVLLDTLLDDNGFRTENIQFLIHGKNQAREDTLTKWKYIPSKDSKRGELDEEKGLSRTEDVLAGIAGGMTGCHALYAVIENLLRNAAKYSKRDDWPNGKALLEIHIDIVEEKLHQSEMGQTEVYVLRMWENLTNDKPADGKTSVANTVRRSLAADVIDEDGKLISGGHGVLEMKLCAKYLAGGLSFPLGQDLQNSNTEDPYEKYLQQERKAERIRKDAAKEAGQNYEPHFRELTAPVLRAYTEDKENRSALIYEMLLPKPVLLGLVCVESKAGEDDKRHPQFGHFCKPIHPNVKRYDDLDSMAKDNPYFGVIVAHDTEPATIDYTLKSIAATSFMVANGKQIVDRCLHAALPYRLVILTRNDSERESWQKALKQAQASTDQDRPFPTTPDTITKAIEDFTYSADLEKGMKQVPILPTRRVHVLVDPGFPAEGNDPASHRLFCSKEQTRHLNEVSEEGWNSLILDLYAKWIESWKGRPTTEQIDSRWRLMIGFNRDYGYADRWIDPLRALGKNKTINGLLDVYVGVRPTSQDPDAPRVEIEYFGPIGDTFQEKARCREIPPIKDIKSCCVFDNHGQGVFSVCTPDNIRFYQEFGASSLSLFQLLDTPPATPFGFAFYILGILESCLLNVATLDERVCDACIPQSGFQVGLTSPLGKMQSAGIHPLFSYGIADNIENQDNLTPDIARHLLAERFITPNIYDTLVEILVGANGITAGNPKRFVEILGFDGVRYSTDNGHSKAIPFREFHKLGTSIGLQTISSPNLPDTLIIHEGVTDTLHKRGAWQQMDHFRLYTLVPTVIRTSGRGNESRELGNELPFIELNIVSDSCYGSPNKIKFGRACLNTSGDTNKMG